MCKFFSLISDGNGKPFYFDWKQRQLILKKDHVFNDEGLVSSFDDKKWRLHAGKGAKIVWEGTIEDLNKQIGE